MINWNCTRCGEGLEAPEDLRGHAIPCPKCGSQQIAQTSRRRDSAEEGGSAVVAGGQLLKRETALRALGLEARIERLEQANHRLRRQLGIAVVGLGAGMLLAVSMAVTAQWRDAGTINQASSFGGGIPDLIEARAFHVVGEDGATLVRLDDGPAGSALGPYGRIATLDPHNRVLVGLGMGEEGDGFVGTWGVNDTIAAMLSGGPRGGGGLSITDGQGEIVVAIGTTRDGAGIIYTYDPSGTFRPRFYTPLSRY